MEELKDKVVLIGMPGCGKTTFGKLLAKELNYKFYDMDDYVEEISGKTVSELFEEGEDVFREWETRACRELVTKKRALISSGGGVIKKDINVQILREKAIIVFIDRPVENIAKDVEVSTRPLLRDGKDKLYTLYSERCDKYKNAADITIVNDGFIKDAIDMCKKKLKNVITN